MELNIADKAALVVAKIWEILDIGWQYSQHILVTVYHCARMYLQLPLQQWGASNVYLLLLSSRKVNIAENPIAVLWGCRSLGAVSVNTERLQTKRGMFVRDYFNPSMQLQKNFDPNVGSQACLSYGDKLAKLIHIVAVTS